MLSTGKSSMMHMQTNSVSLLKLYTNFLLTERQLVHLYSKMMCFYSLFVLFISLLPYFFQTFSTSGLPFTFKGLGM
jgi:hypothetical protein